MKKLLMLLVGLLASFSALAGEKEELVKKIFEGHHVEKQLVSYINQLCRMQEDAFIKRTDPSIKSHKLLDRQMVAMRRACDPKTFVEHVKGKFLELATLGDLREEAKELDLHLMKKAISMSNAVDF